MHPSPLLWAAAFVAASATLGAAPRQLVLDPAASQVTFAVHATVDSFVGTVPAFTLDATIPDGAELPDHAVFSTAVTALKTGKDARDREMLRWLESEKFPQLVFTLRALTPDNGNFRADGDLLLHGVTKPISVPVTIERAGDRLTIRGDAVVDHRDFGLKVIRKFAMLTVRPEVKVAFAVTGNLQ